MPISSKVGHKKVGNSSTQPSIPKCQLLRCDPNAFCFCTNGVLLWDTRTWQVVKAVESTDLWTGGFENVTGVGFGVGFSRDGSQIGLVADGGLRLLRIPACQQVALLQDNMPRIRFVAFSPKSDLVAACTTPDRNVKLWDAKSQTPVRVLLGHSDTVYAAAFSPKGDRLATCSADQTVKLWDPASGDLLHTYRGHVDEVMDVAFSSDGTQLASVAKDGTLKLWNTSAKTSQDAVPESASPLGFYSDGSLLVWSNNLLTALDPATLERKSTIQFSGQQQAGQALGTLNNGRVLSLLRPDSSPSHSKLELWDLLTRIRLCSVESIKAWAAYAPKKGLVATVTASDEMSIWQLPQARRLCVRPIYSGLSHAIFSPNEGLLAAEERADASYGTRLWYVDTNELRQGPLVGRGIHSYDAIAFSPDGRMLARGEWDGSIAIWAIPSGAKLTTLIGHKRSNMALSFSPDGRTLASLADDGSVRLWNVATWRALTKFQLPVADPRANSLSFSNDGRSLFASVAEPSRTHARLFFAPSLAEIGNAAGSISGTPLIYGKQAQVPR